MRNDLNGSNYMKNCRIIREKWYYAIILLCVITDNIVKMRKEIRKRICCMAMYMIRRIKGFWSSFKEKQKIQKH